MLIAALTLSMSVPAVSAATITVTVQTQKAHYTGTTTINVVGLVTHAKHGQVFVAIKNPAGTLVARLDVPIRSGGLFAAVFNAGGPKWSTAGTYTVVATAVVGATTSSGTTTFTYTP